MKLEPYNNPLFVRLIEESYINSSISYHRKDIESILIGLEYLKDSSELYTKSKGIITEYLHNNAVSLQNIKIFILAKVALNYGLKDVQVKSIIRKVSKSSVYPIGEKAHIQYLSRNIDSYRLENIELSDELANQGKNLIRRNRGSVLILATFGLLTDEFISHHIEYLDKSLAKNEFKSSADLLPIIKSAIYLRRNRVETNNDINSKIEKAIMNLSVINQSPEFWFAISETEKIINSNLGSEIDDKVLEIIKNSNIEWTNKIRKIENDSITISMNKSIGLPLNSNSDIFYLIQFLEITGRTNIFTIPNSKREVFEKYVNNTDTSTNRNSLVRLIIFGILCGTILAVSISSALELSVELINNSLDLRLKAKSLNDVWTLLINPFIWIGIIIWWVILVLKSITDPYKNSWIDFFKLFPPFRIVSKFFNQ